MIPRLDILGPYRIFQVASPNKDCLELGKPEINAAYLQENAEMEKANGVHAEFIHPHPV